jgi:uncharacterized membrane protein
MLSEHLSAAFATFLNGLMAGIMVASALIEQSAKALPADSWVRYKQAKERVFGRVMPPLLLSAIVASLAAAVFQRHGCAFGAAALLLVILLAVTLIVHAPLNRAVDAFFLDPPPGSWVQARDRWRRWNLARVAAAAAAFAATILGALTPL